jgi:PKD repeat protein
MTVTEIMRYTCGVGRVWTSHQFASTAYAGRDGYVDRHELDHCLYASAGGFYRHADHEVAPLTVVFTNTSTGACTTSLRHFGDGITSTLQRPVYTYTTPGAYTVTLTVNGPGRTDTSTRASYISVCALPCDEAITNGSFEYYGN